MDENLFGLLRARFPRDRGAPLLETPDGGRTSYGDIEASSARIAGALARAGVAPGDRVAVQVEKSPDVLALYLACLRAGGVFFPLNPAAGDEELAWLLADAQPALLVCDPSRADAAREVARGAGLPRLAVETLDAQGAGSLAQAAHAGVPRTGVVARAAADPAALLYTSGTTGRPKGAVLSHGNLASNARALHAAWGFRPDDVLLHALPVFHAHGLFVALHTTLWNGTSMLWLPRFDVDAVIEALPRITVMMGVPTYYTRLLADPRLDAARCARVRLFVSGSAPLREETFEAFQLRTGHRLLERYGMTETGMIASNPLDGERVAGSVGFALPGVELRLRDAAGEAVPAGAVGGLEVRGPNVFAGYRGRPPHAAPDFREGRWFVTGDLARIDPSGRVFLAGRAKELVITGGLNVYPREVERVIDALPGVLESAVLGIPDADFGEAVVAVVVRRDGARGPDAAALIAGVRRALAPYKAPKQVRFVESLPRNAMGKVVKAGLGALFGAPAPGGQAGAAAAAGDAGQAARVPDDAAP